MADHKKKTWLSILIAGLIIVVVFGLAAIGVTAYWVYGHVSTRITSTETAADEFSRQRARMAGRRPLIEIRGEADEPIVHRNASAPRQELHSLHALAYDPQSGKLVRLDLPAWVLRVMSSGGALRVANVDLMRHGHPNLSIEDLERHGPGLVLDVQRTRGEQVLVWTE